MINFRKFVSVMQHHTSELVFLVARIPLRFQGESRFEVDPRKRGNGLRMI